MSLIQEALRRQQEEMERAQNKGSDTEQPPGLPPPPEPEPPEQPPVPPQPPLPPPAPEGATGKDNKKSFLPVIGMIGFIVLLIAAISYLGWFIFQRFQNKAPVVANTDTQKVVQQPQPVVEPPAEPVSEPETKPEPATRYGRMIRAAENVVAETAERVDSVHDVEEAPSVSTDPVVPEKPAVVPLEKPVEKIEKKVDVETETAPPPVRQKQPARAPVVKPEKPAQPLPKVEWPHLRVSSVLVSNRKGAGSALVNGKVVFVGQEVNGAVLIGVTGDGALFRCGHETNFFSTVSSF